MTKRQNRGHNHCVMSELMLLNTGIISYMKLTVLNAQLIDTLPGRTSSPRKVPRVRCYSEM